jgi:hypothetical protein
MGNGLQSKFTRLVMRHKYQVNFDGEPRHVLDKEVQCRAALHGKHTSLKDIWCNVQEQLDGAGVFNVHTLALPRPRSFRTPQIQPFAGFGRGNPSAAASQALAVA